MLAASPSGGDDDDYTRGAPVVPFPIRAGNWRCHATQHMHLAFIFRAAAHIFSSDIYHASSLSTLTLHTGRPACNHVSRTQTPFKGPKLGCGEGTYGARVLAS